jgi:hypothetical protein
MPGRRSKLLVLFLILTSLWLIPGSPSAGASGLVGWKEVTPDAPWEARAGLQVVRLNRSFFLMGGRTPNPPSFPPIPGDSVIHGDVWRSDDFGRTWREIQAQAPWSARAYFQAVTKGGRVFVLGGQDFSVVPNTGCPPFPTTPPCPPFVSESQFFNDVWSSSDGATWRQETAGAGWAGRAGLSATVLNGEIYVMGGSFNDDPAVIGGPPTRVYFNDVWKSSDGITWEQVTDEAPWAPRAGAVAVTKGGYIYLLGGEDGFLCDPARPDRCPPYFNDVWRSADGEDWEQVTAAAGWSPRPGHQCVVMLKRFVCFGGFGLPTNPADMWMSRTGANWWQLPIAPWNATSPDDVKYDFDALVARRAPWLPPEIFTFGGDRETFDFQDPTNYLRVDDDVWRFGLMFG